MIKLFNMSCFDYLDHCAKARMMFADPPDNIGLKYRGFKDRCDSSMYAQFMEGLIVDAIKKCDVFWLSFNPKYTSLVGYIAYSKVPTKYEVKPCVQTFTFGQHNHKDLGVNHRPLWRFMRKGTELYPDAIRVPSWRQLNGDKRADPRGRVPGDVFDFPRVTGNSKQRRKFSPTQLHEGLYERCIKLCCKPGDLVVDLFAGSGTLGRVADRCDVHGYMVEISDDVCAHIEKDQGIERLC